jgi:FMN reductase
MWGEPTAPLRGKPAAIAMTGASLHHFLALNDLRAVLSVFFAAHVLPPGLYVPRDGFDEPGTSLQDPYAKQADLTGRALAESANLLSRSTALRQLEPQA